MSENRFGHISGAGVGTFEETHAFSQLRIAADAEQEVISKRDMILWTVCFDRAPAALHDSLALGQPILKHHPAHWDQEWGRLAQEVAGWAKGTTAVRGRGVRVEEVSVDRDFVDCWAGGLVAVGWMEEGELTSRRANRVMVSRLKVDSCTY
jgi:hypothetical protein